MHRKERFVYRIAVLIVSMLVLWGSNAFCGSPGNVDGMGEADLKDAVMSLQIGAGIDPDGVTTDGDVNGDGKIGLEEAIYDLQKVALLRTGVWYKDSDEDGYSDGTVMHSDARPYGGYYKESELIAVSGDTDDNDPQIFPSGGITEITRIQESIQESGAGWTADTNPISSLPKEERKMRLGAIPENIPESAKRTFSRRSGLPSSFDWTNNNGSFVTPVKNQGGCGSCWAFASTAALESQVLIKSNRNQNIDLSEQIIVSCSGAGSCDGGYMGSTAHFLRVTGTNLETCYPYTGTNGNCSNACPNWMDSAYRLDGWIYISGTVENLKNALYMSGPVVTMMGVYEDFFSYKSGVYRYTWGKLAGYHAIVITGWDDSANCFTAKNSWNTGWGESGFFRVGYGEIEANRFAIQSIAYMSYGISPASQSFDSPGGTGTVNVALPYPDSREINSWTAQSNVNWISITSGSSGTGNGSITYSVEPNLSGLTSRTGTITVAGKTFTVTQAVACNYTLSPSYQAVNAGGGGGSVSVIAPEGCGWTAVSNHPDWLTVVSGFSGSGNGTMNFSVSENSGIRSRTGMITVAGHTFTVTQAHSSSSLTVPDDYDTIQAAIDAVSDGMTVWVADGTYTGTGNKNLDFKGKKISLRSENGPAATVIDCENSGRGFYFHSGETAESLVSGFTVKNGNVMNTGGGIHCENSSPVISNCVITNCQITLNYTSGNDFGGGAGIYAKDSNIAITDSIITNCTVNGQWANCGGGGLYFYNNNASVSKFPSVVNCLISNNKAELAIGGGIYSDKCSVTIANCNITDCSAWYGGGFWISGSGYTSGSGLTNAVITDTNILRNTAKMAGGMEVDYYARLTIERCNISENIANRDGGGGLDASTGSSVTLKNCIMAKNTAVSGGGGMECSPGAILNIISSTIADNNGTAQGGAIYCPTTSPPSSNCIPNIINSIVWGNIPDQIYLWDPDTSPVISYSDIQDSGYAGADNISANPLFAGNGDYHLTAASPCINTGTSGSNIPDTDIEGKARPQGSGYDMGAYEW